MTNEESLKIWEQEHIEILTSREMGEWLYRRDMNARPQGEWICDNILHLKYHCSKCRNDGNNIQPFCGWCGAKMKGGAE